MDWKSLTSKLDPLKAKLAPYTKKLDPFVEKAKEMGVKTLDFTQRQMQNTPLVLKTQKELDDVRSAKRLIVITYDQSDVSSRELLLRAPVWATRAWSDATELRWVERSASPDIVSSLGVTTPVDMHVWYMSQETFHGKDVESILAWWKTRCYDGKSMNNEELIMHNDKPSKPTQEPEKTTSDPLAGK